MRLALRLDQLVPGMYVAELDRPWVETPFLFQGFVLQTRQEIDILRRFCDFVYVDVEQSRPDSAVSAQLPRSAYSSPKALIVPSSPVVPRHDVQPSALNAEQLSRQWQEAGKVRFLAKRYLDRLLADVRLGGSVDTSRARDVVRRLAETVSAKTSAALWMTNLKNRDEYTAIHCLNVPILSMAFAYHLKLPYRQVEVIGLGALLHDIGKMNVPDAVLNKPGPLTDAESAVMR